MGFKKTSVGLSPATQVASPLPHIGEEKDGRVWTGDAWVSKAEWERLQAKGSQLPGNEPSTVKEA